MKIVLEPLTQERFEPFGQVLDLPANPGRADYSKHLENRRAEARVCFRTSMTAASTLPIKTTTMERHAHSSQAFVPVEGGQYVVMVAPNGPDGGPDMTAARAFLAESDQGINYKASVWHHPMTVLERAATFTTVMWLADDGEDEEFFALEREVEIVETDN